MAFESLRSIAKEHLCFTYSYYVSPQNSKDKIMVGRDVYYFEPNREVEVSTDTSRWCFPEDAPHTITSVSFELIASWDDHDQFTQTFSETLYMGKAVSPLYKQRGAHFGVLKLSVKDAIMVAESWLRKPVTDEWFLDVFDAIPPSHKQLPTRSCYSHSSEIDRLFFSPDRTGCLLDIVCNKTSKQSIQFDEVHELGVYDVRQRNLLRTQATNRTNN